jgi:hypothetical protein
MWDVEPGANVGCGRNCAVALRLSALCLLVAVLAVADRSDETGHWLRWLLTKFFRLPMRVCLTGAS